jgi:hypothetical protein
MRAVTFDQLFILRFIDSSMLDHGGNHFIHTPIPRFRDIISLTIPSERAKSCNKTSKIPSVLQNTQPFGIPILIDSRPICAALTL